MFRPHRILIDQRWSECVDKARHSFLAPGHTSFANSHDSVVGLDNDEQKIPLLTYDMGTNILDLHGWLFPSALTTDCPTGGPVML